MVALREAFAMRATIRTLLEHAPKLSWTVQGFGMMRAYFGADKKYRLNIWDSSLAVPNVSILHTHPWFFTSWIMSGAFRNIRYYESPADGRYTHDWAVIKTGEGGGPDGERGSSRLTAGNVEIYSPGDRYAQQPDEIHASYYDDGTVTLNDRTRVGDGEHARVFWPHGEQWVDAEPRQATPAEVEATLSAALSKWDRYIPEPTI